MTWEKTPAPFQVLKFKQILTIMDVERHLLTHTHTQTKLSSLHPSFVLSPPRSWPWSITPSISCQRLPEEITEDKTDRSERGVDGQMKIGRTNLVMMIWAELATCISSLFILTFDHMEIHLCLNFIWQLLDLSVIVQSAQQVRYEIFSIRSCLQ